MKTFSMITVMATLFIFLGCGQAGQEQYAFEEVSDSTSNAVISSTAAVENPKDSNRKFIRTADLKFRVNSVIQSTYQVENITARQGGFVTFTNLSSEVDHVSEVPVSADSILETTYYTVTNSIILRVPNTKLDTTLKEIAHIIDFLDYRIIKADDVALQMLSNRLAVSRSEKSEALLGNAIENRGKKLNETADAGELLLSKQETADQARLSNLALSDQISFSTVNLSIYQRQTIKKELIPNHKNIDAYDPGLGSKVLDSMKSGWKILELIIVFLAGLWGIALIAVTGYFIYKKYTNKQKK